MEIGINVVGLALAICLGFVHIFADRTEWLVKFPRSWWTSFAGGTSIAYVFLHILPELSHAQEEIAQGSAVGMVEYLENHAYILALLGLVLFYGLEKLALRSRDRQGELEKTCTHPHVFWLHMIAFFVYNAILGYVLRESEEHGLLACLLLFFALAFHLVVNDVSLRDHHKHMYDRVGRWLLGSAIVMGWSLGEAFHFNEAALVAVWAFIAGGIVLNVLKEELPEKQESNFGMFAAGTVFYMLVLLAAESNA